MVLSPHFTVRDYTVLANYKNSGDKSPQSVLKLKRICLILAITTIQGPVM